MLINRLRAFRSPVTAFNGGLFVRPDLSVIRERADAFGDRAAGH